eukprot:8594597-Pyramimonas_sp.AAC.1
MLLLKCFYPPSNVFLPFEESRSFARALGLGSKREWREWCASGARPLNVPSAPDRTYLRAE